MNKVKLSLQEANNIVSIMDEMMLPEITITKESNGIGISTTLSYESTIIVNGNTYTKTININMPDVSNW